MMAMIKLLVMDVFMVAVTLIVDKCLSKCLDLDLDNKCRGKGLDLVYLNY